MKLFRRHGVGLWSGLRLRYYVSAPDWRTWKKLAGDVREQDFIEGEVQDRICEALGNGREAMWSDPRETLQVAAKGTRGLRWGSVERKDRDA